MHVMHVGSRGGSRAWRGLLGRRPDWGIGPPSQRVSAKDRLADGQALSGVVTKQHAHHVLRAARLHEGMDTVLLRDLTELPANLSV